MPLQPIRELSLPPSNLRTEMEDCDFGDVDMDKEHSFGERNFHLAFFENTFNLIIIFLTEFTFSSSNRCNISSNDT